MSTERPSGTLFEKLNVLNGTEKLGLFLAFSGAAELVAGTVLTITGGFTHNTQDAAIGVKLMCAGSASLLPPTLIFLKKPPRAGDSNQP